MIERYLFSMKKSSRGSTKIIHAVRLVCLQEQSIIFCNSARHAKRVAWERDLDNPDCFRIAKHLGAAPEIFSVPADAPFFAYSWTSDYDGGGYDFHAPAESMSKVLKQVAHHPRKVPARLIHEIAETKDRKGISVKVNKKWNSVFSVRYVGTAAELRQKQLEERRKAAA